MTLIVLLILAGVSLSSLFSEKGLFNRTESAGAKYNEAKARETLETVLLADAQYEKHSNPAYNQDDFLDDLIKNEIPGSDVKGDVAIIGEYAYELDRSVPKIGRYLGKAEDLVFPTVTATVQLAEDKKNAIINITALEEKNGINKIEIWLLGEKIAEYPYDNIKTEIKLPHTATQNGKYTIKAYGNIMASTTATVEGIMPEIKFEPNGNETWEKEHSTKITVEETEEKVTSMKYQWTNSVAEPADNTFTENCKDGDTIMKNNVTGTYYLWILLETESGATAKRRSEGFNFDNEGPTITALTATGNSATAIILSATAQDIKSGIAKFEFYVDDVLKGTETCTATTTSVTKSITITGLSTGSHSCKVIVYDAKNNSSNKAVSGNTKLYTWDKFSVTETTKWKSTSSVSKASVGVGSWDGAQYLGFCSSNGYFATGTRIQYRPNAYSSVAKANPNSFYRTLTIYSPGTYCCGTFYANITTYKAESTTTYSKGTTSYGTVSSTNPNAYPNNEKSGSYWYVYKGVY